MNVEQKTFRVPNIGCDGCVRTIVNELGQVEGIRKVEGDVNSKTVKVEWVAPATWSKIEETLEGIDYPPEKALMP
jgi:copper chaperone CopZ